MDTSHGYMNVDQPNKENSSNELLSNESVHESVLRLVGQGNKWFLSIKNFKVSKDFTTKTEAEWEVENPSWQTMLNIIGTMIELSHMDRLANIEKAIHEANEIAKLPETGLKLQSL